MARRAVQVLFSSLCQPRRYALQAKVRSTVLADVSAELLLRALSAGLARVVNPWRNPEPQEVIPLAREPRRRVAELARYYEGRPCNLRLLHLLHRNHGLVLADDDRIRPSARPADHAALLLLHIDDLRAQLRYLDFRSALVALKLRLQLAELLHQLLKAVVHPLVSLEHAHGARRAVEVVDLGALELLALVELGTCFSISPWSPFQLQLATHRTGTNLHCDLCASSCSKSICSLQP